MRFTSQTRRQRDSRLRFTPPCKYDLIGKLAEETTADPRNDWSNPAEDQARRFSSQYRVNPEDFIRKAARLINEQKATVIVEHLAYSPMETPTILTSSPGETEGGFQQSGQGQPSHLRLRLHRFRDRTEVRWKLDSGTEVEVYAKLPKASRFRLPLATTSPTGRLPSSKVGEAHLLHRGDQGLHVIDGNARDRRNPRSSAPGSSLQRSRQTR